MTMIEVKKSCYDILVVEDSLTQALLLKDTLEKSNFKVKLAKDGQDAVEQLNGLKPDLIISDIEMPRMNGFEFCRVVKSSSTFSSIPVIILTNLSDSMDVIKGIKSGADSFLTKPCTTSVLLETIQDILHNPKQRQDKSFNHVLEFSFKGETHNFEINLAQVTNLLLSIYATAIQKNKELEQAYQKLTITNQEIEKANAELQRLNEQKNFFLGMAAHDLRSPLTAIQGYSELLLEKNAKDADSKKMLERVHSSSEFMLHLVNDLLDLSAIESGKVKLNLKRIDLNTLIEECIALTTMQAEKKQITINYSKANDIPEVECDPEKLEQVINNLVVNAIKYSNPQTTIEVALKKEGSNAVITVKDQGIGIAKEEVDKLFNPFTKTSSKMPGEKSTGLGLAIAKRIIVEQKGQIFAESEKGKGSTFTIKLPI